MAIAVYPGSDLIENIFASRPDDFKTHGVFTCRFYVEGEWVEVITDTKIPSIRDQITGHYLPVYSHSGKQNEMWISFIEKAYAKAVGNYESIQKAKVTEALLQLTGGSVQQVQLNDEKDGELKDAWALMHSHMANDTMILALPVETESHEHDSTDHDLQERDDGSASLAEEGETAKPKRFIPNKLYSIVSCKEIGSFELVLLHNPWTEGACWNGSWSDASNDWETYPELLQEIESDPKIQWRRNSPKGYFWMSFKSFNKRFNTMFFCKVFPNNKFSYYCMRGEWLGNEAGGLSVTVRDRDAVAKEATESKFKALHKSVASEVIDGDCSWFNNPQFRVRSAVPTSVYVSIVPLRGAELDKDSSVDMSSAPVACLSIVSYSKTTVNPHLWDASQCEVCSNEFNHGSGKNLKGQETSIWKQNILPSQNYQIVPTTLRRGLLGSFILRVFSRHPIIVESVDKLFTSVQSGAWTKDSSGGSLRTVIEDKLKENPKWCQNPQFYWNLNNLFGKDELHLKVVVRRTDIMPQLKTAVPGGNEDPNIGLVICKAEQFFDAEEMAIRNKGKSVQKGKPRENAMGEVIVSRSSTLRKKSSKSLFEEEEIRALRDAPPKKKKILRKTSMIAGGPLAGAEYVLESTFSSKKEACIYFPKLPRSCISSGLVIVPCMNQANVRGKFDIEVYCSEKFDFSLVPDSESKVLAGSWNESASGGSHLNPNWKKNPKYSLRLKGTHKSMLGEDGAERYYNVRISLCRHGSSWRNKERKDTVGCMISFYVFISRNNELIEVYSAPFSPTSEVCTEDDFKLQPLKKGEEYIIMPTTNAPDVFGNFVLSLMCEQEFIFTTLKDKSSNKRASAGGP